MTKPVFGTYEWAKYSINCVSGCSHMCRYCYARANAIKNKKKTAENWNEEVINEKAINKEYKKYDGVVMFPTTHDITPNTLEPCLKVLHKLLKIGNKVLIVSKPHIECIKKLCIELKEYKDNILFRFTIGSADNDILKLWEPKAPDFQERIDSLTFAFKDGFQTSVSCEPMLDGNIDEVVKIVEPFVTDAIWLGTMNFAENRLKINGEKDLIPYARKLGELHSKDNIMDLYERFKDNNIIKWKDSIKEVVGLERITEPGLDK